ncbi:UDP-N-acetylmuramate dehydrogenase [Desertihabitans brevis]|uniref:UDP-N-acetylenolpyruvoylglucosamine reductase n=1 Tax=Desertihabitans brevis TaxID=2268447 RepID=A0A367YUY7_9ACTN|nr:UDP-N-acetylmuramate dehydrogenase [Desertihabitans brevis]RCK69705.1 UDP-N-acetylmuramate dehydrogenase [Desertihabitans brevis]
MAEPAPSAAVEVEPAGGELIAAWTTLRLGGPARRSVVASTAEELVELVADCDARGEPVLVLGGGSNVVVADEGFDGTVVRVASRGVDVDASDCAGATLVVAAGEPWDALVARTVTEEMVGLEALSGIPGLTGACPIQNVGAYGADVSQSIATVRTYDRVERRMRTFPGADCGFGYRTSRFKAEPGRYLVLEVTFHLRLGTLGAPVRYAELARRLGVDLGERAPAADVREAVLALRAGKGMVLDADDHDTWSAGSFFTNPVLEAEVAERLPDGAPRFAQPDGRVKTSAAWLIDSAGFGRGWGTPPATLSTKHALALTNRGGATTAQLLELAARVRAGVHETYGVVLEPEPVLVGCVLPPVA